LRDFDDGSTTDTPMGNVRPRSEGSTLDVGSLFDEHFDHLSGTLRRLGVRSADLKDLVHEVCLKIHMRRAECSTPPACAWRETSLLQP
jgi:DNA-directed RNA polymerase specialized sigma24 family protein